MGHLKIKYDRHVQGYKSPFVIRNLTAWLEILNIFFTYKDKYLMSYKIGSLAICITYETQLDS